ncbi:30S ribosomal protein S7 [Candidatus Woesebacteria bacterium RIFOXYC1_FULL_31_51]|uniref:Small ribosomal subunit protein uS7 n=1 Tax=Candidatus Woesebacteria bacterium GW2011_GWC2_31_9 TaxID=1618586 RepID=A0A0F9YKT5_9BACT|nr:MAG: 30S ribosomal protein S7, small subunit ribosomal protein S7 [Candidatus Woesebacteria bacterium GW2011_GWF1_31_35]KKP23306.1 MAG: 30S ribosomal protein S7 [Candidatus Woesebacteria bacterium GW2011_GWC1_30_29]KKP26176.1 MAG: 30S ribosomal protein S7 [Candidatus Woesebacteria bacterium GW2011_GWD1_31_12]KKP27567.1 MAG: 30S ribosomal protein S7 [Candidatus Woesebacteria bacterium GW2011_GWB1_31_29]KKP32084.1 MAG: 30S ribosomal protein S7 [Candidatus Woesebacteria bacterium GW2011_GWC2_31
MPRKGPSRKRLVEVDPLYQSRLLAKFINRSMHDGKKSVSQREIYNGLKIIAEKTKEDPIKIFEKAIENIKPEMEVRAKRVGGAAYQVPMQVREERKESLAIRWLVAAARARSNSEFHTYGDKIAQELIDASNSEGGAVKKRMEMEKQADANRAFSHFKW